MKLFGDKLKELRTDANLTQDELIKFMNDKYNNKISKSMISKWENNKEEPQKFSYVSALASFFNIKADYLIGLSDSKYGDEEKYRKIPVLNTISSILSIYDQKNIQKYEYISNDDNSDFCFKIENDSMINLRISNGDIIFVHRQSSIEDGEIAVVRIDDEIIVRRICIIKEFYILKSENIAYKDLIFKAIDKNKNFKIIGKILYFKSEVI